MHVRTTPLQGTPSVGVIRIPLPRVASLRDSSEQIPGFGSHTYDSRPVQGSDVLQVDHEPIRGVPSGAWQREFLQLLDAHGATLMAMLRRLCGNPHDAEDVFQETAVRVWRSLAGWPRLRNPRAWVMTIGYRAFLDMRGRRERHEALHDPPDARYGSPEDAAERSEQSDRVQAAIADLPDAAREVVVLHYLGGLTLRQTAAAMEVSQGTVKGRLHAALVKLRRVLE